MCILFVTVYSPALTPQAAPSAPAGAPAAPEAISAAAIADDDVTRHRCRGRHRRRRRRRRRRRCLLLLYASNAFLWWRPWQRRRRQAAGAFADAQAPGRHSSGRRLRCRRLCRWRQRNHHCRLKPPPPPPSQPLRLHRLLACLLQLRQLHSVLRPWGGRGRVICRARGSRVARDPAYGGSPAVHVPPASCRWQSISQVMGRLGSSHFCLHMSACRAVGKYRL